VQVMIRKGMSPLTREALDLFVAPNSDLIARVPKF